MRRLVVMVGATMLVLALALPASGITRGTPDGDGHPYVGLMIAEEAHGEGVPVPAWRCSGALISPTVFVTAGHCTDGAAGAQVWFEADVVRGEGDPELYPYGGGTRGTVFTHPAYDDAAFFLADLGVVVLDEPVELETYASLPEVDELDTLGKGRNRAAVTAVGYGLQRIRPELQSDLTRTRADLFVVNRTGFIGLKQAPGSGWFALSADARGGGTCFGDSGGPVLLGDTILGVVSFGIDPNCAATGGAYRIDRQDDLDFIRNLLPDPSDPGEPVAD